MKHFAYMLAVVFAYFFPIQKIDAQVISGRVMSLDKDDNMEDLIGASVYMPALKKGVLTNSKGMFTIDLEGAQGYLIFSYAGFTKDSLFVPSKYPIHMHLRALEKELQEVVVHAGNAPHDRATTLQTEVLTVKTLSKAACCNLSESFETNASVSVNYSDAVTGAKQIQLLGLSGQYVQTNTENMPSIRGLKTTFGLNYVPGTWIQSIDLSKGQSSVVNGYESIAGAINIELAKPDTTDKYFLNTYTNSQGRFEINQQGAKKFNERLSSGWFAHYSSQAYRYDGNGDGFLDIPLYQQVNLLNRWKYKTENWMAQWGVNVLFEDRLAGQSNFDANTSDRFRVYGFGNKTNRIEGFAKVARLFQNKPYKGLGLILNAYNHTSNAFFSYRNYVGNEQSMYANLIYQSIIGNTNHTFRTGSSFLYDSFQETYFFQNLNRTEIVPGAFFEYTYTFPEKFTLIVGNRVDFHNQLGTQWVPRIHLKWDASEDLIFRFSSGKGWRRVNFFADNFGFLANQRQLSIQQSTGSPMDIAWNTGGSVSYDFFLNNRKLNVVLDAFRTDFEQQWLWDMETGGTIYVYKSPGKSFATSYQMEINYSPLKRFDIKAAYRYQDVQADYKLTNGGTERLEKPFINKDRVLINLAYYTPQEKWKFDYTFQWNGTRRIPNADVYHVHDSNQLNSTKFSPAFSTSYAQITRKLKKWEMYVGAENMFNFKQENPVMLASNPFSTGFDATMVWGPVTGRMIYLGTRLKIN
ncbi:MAG: hypothetical protein RI995_1198 [Bacteroidota bacterium]